ncbi:MAG TPA: DUF2470 domain-containing protein [Stellaceae bacterium]|nr:DUF2470 domain-containing protein [Stellaceae bacterium]
MGDDNRESPALAARRLMRTLDRATLATSRDGWPYASLVMVALEHDARPLLLLSDLAEHTKNIKKDPHISLLFDGTAGRDDPLTGPRATVLGEATRIAEPPSMARFVARHPAAGAYSGFKDFNLYRVEVASAHLVAGFGRIDWITGDQLLYTRADPALASSEDDILRHMSDDHAPTVDLYASRLAGCSGTGWRLTGVDPEGIDLRRGGAVARLDFESPVRDAEGARIELVRLARKARGEV